MYVLAVPTSTVESRWSEIASSVQLTACRVNTLLTDGTPQSIPGAVVMEARN